MAALTAGCVAGSDDDAAPAAAPVTTAVPTTSTTAPTTTTTAPTTAAGAGSTTTTAAPTTSTTAPLPEVGDCLGRLGTDGSAVAPPATAPCDGPHDAEVYAVVVLDDRADAPFPGDGPVRAAADARCFAAFEPALDRPYLGSGLEVVHLRPTAVAWRDGDRRVVCAVVDLDGEPLTAPVGAGR